MPEYYDDPERKQVLKTGATLAGILIGFGERGFGSIAEMALSSSTAVILGNYGYQGIIDTREKKLYDFQKGSAHSYGSFTGVYKRVAKDLGLEWVRVENTMMTGHGDDSAVIRMLKQYHVPETVQTVIDGRHTPQAGLVKIGQTEGEYDAAKFTQVFTGLAGTLAQGLDARVNGLMKIVPDSNNRIIKPVDWDEVHEVMAAIPEGDIKNFAWWRNQLKHPQPTFIPR